MRACFIRLRWRYSPLGRLRGSSRFSTTRKTPHARWKFGYRKQIAIASGLRTRGKTSTRTRVGGEAHPAHERSPRWRGRTTRVDRRNRRTAECVAAVYCPGCPRSLHDIRLVIDAMDDVDGELMMVLASWRDRIERQLHHLGHSSRLDDRKPRRPPDFHRIAALPHIECPSNSRRSRHQYHQACRSALCRDTARQGRGGVRQGDRANRCHRRWQGRLAIEGIRSRAAKHGASRGGARCELFRLSSRVAPGHDCNWIFQLFFRTFSLDDPLAIVAPIGLAKREAMASRQVGAKRLSVR